MPLPADLLRAVQTTLASKRLGTPVFARVLFHNQGKRGQAAPGEVVAELTRTAGMVREWLGQPLERVYAVGAVKTGQVSLTLEFRNAATAIVSWSGTSTAGDGVDLTLVGNHGALYHDVGAGNLWDPAPDAKPPEPDKELRTMIERSLQSGRPENVEKRGQR